MKSTTQQSTTQQSTTLPVLLFLALLAFSAAHMFFYYPLLPDTVASHFDGSGEPDGWSSKRLFFGIYAGTVALMAVIFGGIGVGLPRLPVGRISMPNRNYWLAPERRQETYAALSSRCLWFGVANLVLLILVFHLVFRFNLGDGRAMGTSFWVLFSAFMAFTVGWVVELLVRFRKPAEGPEPP